MNAMLVPLLLELITIMNFIFIIITVFIERKKPMTAMFWILALTFLPAVGFVLYLIFGRNLRINKNKDFKAKKAYDELYSHWLMEQKNLLNDRKIDFTDPAMSQYYDIIEMHLNMSRSIYTQDNDITIFTSAQEKYDALLQDIENARDTIHMLYFIINNDGIGRKVVELLAKKAAQGVQVRLLYDHIGSIFTPFSMFKELIRNGGKVYRFFPLRLGSYLRMNFRNHRKIVVIDGKTGYVGGINIGDEYMGLHKRKKPWRDTHLRITGTAVYFLQERFLMDWLYASKEKAIDDISVLESFFPQVTPLGQTGVQIVSSGPDSSGEQIKRGYIKMIHSARSTLYIQSPYFVPDDPFLEALQIAAMSGVDVRIMLPAIPDKWFVYRIATSYIEDLLSYGIKVYLYPGFLHAKMVVMDGKIASLGTTNIDIRSFMLDFEVNAFVYNTEFAQRCKDIFEKDMAGCRLVTREWYDSRSLWVKFQEGICRLFSPLM